VFVCVCVCVLKTARVIIFYFLAVKTQKVLCDGVMGRVRVYNI